MRNMARPFLKWAGGKRQLLQEIESRLPEDFDKCTSYIEPFVGGGAVLFHLLEKRTFDEIHISDINPELVLCYRTLKSDAKSVIEHITKMIEGYPTDLDDREEVYYAIRSDWNNDVGAISKLGKKNKAKRVAQTLFLNKTCFNGLFRVNKKGEFNVPIGSYETPSFPNIENLLDVQEKLQAVTIHQASYENCINWINGNSFVYFDPPYRPLSDTSHFVSYSKGDFNDSDQIRLAKVFDKLNQKGAKILLSNSDPKNSNENDDFFDELYKGYEISRVFANRSINSVPKKRGPITELLISNY